MSGGVCWGELSEGLVSEIGSRVIVIVFSITITISGEPTIGPKVQ